MFPSPLQLMRFPSTFDIFPSNAETIRYYHDDQMWLWLEGIQLKPEANNKLKF